MANEADFKRIGNYARMYNRDQNINRLKCTRTVPMQVLCPGYSRTGTLTMQKALEILGYPTYHFSSFYDNPSECDLWLRAMDAKFNGKGEVPGKRFWDGLLGHVGAVTDAPCNLFARELLEFYPDAKVVLVEREIESWFRSWMDFCQSAYNPILAIIARLDPYWAGRIASVGDAITQKQAGYAKNLGQVKARSKDAYKHHYRDVRDLIADDKERLLDFDLKQGWEPLCQFLGKPIPDTPFPHENDKDSNKKSFEELGIIAIKHILRNALAGAAAIGAPLAAAYYYRKSR